MQAIAPFVVMFSVLFPTKMWFAPDQAINVEIKGARGDVSLVLCDFNGRAVEGEISVDITGDQMVDLKQYWPQMKTSGTYLLLAVPKGQIRNTSQFVGTPLVVSVRDDKRRDAAPGPMVVRVEPLRYALMSTDKGDMTMAFYYESAPDTVSNFQTLAEQGFYDGLSFHRIVPDFVLQGGDPRGDGTGGPGYHIEAEFNSRKHEEGVLSMARQGDPIERQGAMPRTEAANSAGSQFFLCLNYDTTKQLDGRYTAFGKVTDGMQAAKEIAKVPTDPKTEKPLSPQLIKSIRIVPVTADKNPYAAMMNWSGAATQPSQN